MAETPATCGIIMPIADTDGYPAGHWADVLAIFREAITAAGMTPKLVSAAAETSVIHKRIIGNVYDNELALCDVSSRNPNVMFELGLRIAFDKPVVIVKDDRTPYSFDVGPIEQLGYGSALRYGEVNAFKEALADKLRATRSADHDQTSVLKALGPLHVAKLETKAVPGIELVLDEVQSLRSAITRLSAASGNQDNPFATINALRTPSPTKEWGQFAVPSIDELTKEDIDQLLHEAGRLQLEVRLNGDGMRLFGDGTAAAQIQVRAKELARHRRNLRLARAASQKVKPADKA